MSPLIDLDHINHERAEGEFDFTAWELEQELADIDGLEPTKLRVRAVALREMAGVMHPLVAQAVRRHSAALDLAAWIGDVRQGRANFETDLFAIGF